MKIISYLCKDIHSCKIIRGDYSWSPLILRFLENTLFIYDKLLKHKSLKHKSIESLQAEHEGCVIRM
jgi:hypothetical protein